MEEKRINLLEKYKEYHLTNNKKTPVPQSLETDGRALLSSVEPENRYRRLGVNFYKNVLEKIAQKFEGNEDSIQKMKAGFSCLEKYAINLWKFPWRKEYHTIKLYTAFFKGNVQEQLRDMDAIFSILECLGYKGTGQDEFSLKEPDTVHAPRVSLELFLVQLDLEVIKEIMENFPESKCTLKEIVSARRRNADVESARKYLERKIAKRQKLDVAEGGDVTQSKKIKEVHVEGIDARFPDENQKTFSRYTPSTAFKNPRLSNTCDANDMNGDDSSAGFLVTDEDPSAAASTDPRGTISKRLFSNMDLADQDLYGVEATGSQLHGGRHGGLDAHCDVLPHTLPTSYSAHIKAGTSMGGSHSFPYNGTCAPAGSHHRSHIQGVLQHINVVSQSETNRPTTRVTVSTTATKAKVSVRAVPLEQGTSGYNDKYANLRDIRISSSACADQPVKRRSHEGQNNFSALSNGMAEGERARPTGHAGITDLKSDLKYRLTLSNTDVGSRAKAPQHFTDTSKERRPYDSQRLAGEKEGTRSQDKSSGQTHLSKQKSIYNAEAANYPGRSTAEVKGYTVEKIETKGAEPVPSGATVDKKSSKDLTSPHYQAAEAQYSDHSSRIGPNSEDVLNCRGSSLAAMKQQKDHIVICDFCMAESNIICRNCLQYVCGKCVRIYNTDLCTATKGQHNFVELKKKSQPMSADSEALPNQPGSNASRETGSDDKAWSCSRCTFLNSPEHGICAMCASSRGVNLVDQTEVGSRVCGICTFHNKRDAKVCEQCGKTLDLTGPPESCV